MEHAANKNVKMGVHQVKTILDIHNSVLMKKDVVGDVMKADLFETDITTTEALLDSVLQSTREVASILKSPESVHNKKCNGFKEMESNLKETMDTQEKGLSLPVVRTWSQLHPSVTPAPPKIASDNMVTLNLDPVPMGISGGNFRWKKASYYSKVTNNHIANTKTLPGHGKGSAVKKFQEWHARHIETLAFSNAMNAATSKLKAYAATTEGGIQNIQHVPKLPLTPKNSAANSVPTASKPAMPKTGSENIQSGQKRKYCTISNNYFQYLNRPKRARHDSLQIVFKAFVLLDEDHPAEHSDASFPKGFISWPSGKIPLPGYKTKRSISRLENFIPLKKKRTTSKYRVPKPKPKANPPMLQHFPYNTFQKPNWPPIRKPLPERRFFPLEKLKWDPASRRYTVHANAKATQPKKGQWFTFPSVSTKGASKPGSFSYNDAIRKKFGVSGAPLSSFRPNLQFQTHQKTLYSPVKIQQNRKEINVVFKCVRAPKPECFGTFDEYTAMCVLYQIRKIMAARAMRYGYVEGRFDSKPKTEAVAQNADSSIEGVQPPPKKEVSNSIVLISTHTEMTFTMWSTALPQASELDKTAALATSKSEGASGISSRWLHVCKSDFVEELPQGPDNNLSICPKDEAEEKLFKEASDAWLDNNLSDGEVFLAPAKTLGVARHTGEPPYSVPSRVALRSFDTSSSSQPNHNLYNGVVHSKKQSVACNGHGKMQRSLSEIRSLSRERSDVRKKPRVLPKPSYCVRFRMCFCNFDCSCGIRTRFLESNFVKSTSKAAVKLKNGVKLILTSLDNSPESLGNIDDNGFYDFNEKSDVPSVILKSPSLPSPSKWDVRHRRSRSQSAVETSKIEWLNGFCDRGIFVKKIGETEIYRKWAVRRFSLPESDFDSIVEDVEHEKLVRKMGNTEIVHRKAVKRMLTPEKHEERARSISVGTEMSNLSSLSNDDDMEIEFEIVEEILVDPDRIDTFTFANETECIPDECAQEQMNEQTAHSTETDVKLGTPVNKECLYISSKQVLSSMARYELGAFAVSYRRRVNVEALVEKENTVEIAALSIRDRNRNNGDLESSQLRLGNESSCDESDKPGRHVSNPIGRDDSKHKHVNDSPDGQSLEGSVSSGDSCKAGASSDPTIGDDGMGNTFRKQKTERELSPVLKSKYARTYANVLSNTQNVHPVLPNGILKPVEEFLGYTTTNLTDCRRSLEARYGSQQPMDYVKGRELNGHLDTQAAVTKERKNETVDDQEKPSVASNDVERKTRSKTFQSLAVNGRCFQTPDFSKTTNKKPSATAVDDTDSQIVTRKRKFDAIQDVKLAKNAAAKLELSDRDGLKSAKKREIAPGNAETDLPVETRSSRRLRSRVNKKRGRYESDYVADLPKANKKPKRVLPTREYDNNDFWQFYRENERTLYSKNLILQNKYIKLLKSKGISSGFAGTPTALFSNVICASSAVPSDTSSTSVVPEDGLMPFMKRLTKPRKTIPELPKADDNHCAYCGRSFSGEAKRAFEDHLARHGMKYTMLAAPQLSKKKKKTKNGRNDSVFKRPKPNNNSSRTVIVVDPQKSKIKDPRISSVLDANSECTEQCDKLEPLPKPSHLSMGHRKQTARKSFSLASTLPKNMLIAALECKMRAQSTLKTDKTQPASAKPMAVNQSFSPAKAARESPSEVIQGSSNDILTPCTREFLPKPHSARKTLTGLPITYTHLNRNYIQALTSPTKSFR